MPRVAGVIIGDEILTGKFADENGPFLIRELRALGADLDRIAVISDRVEHIADEVRRCASDCDWVVTTGGVGPTHDDRTFEGIAAAFGVSLVLHPELSAQIDAYGLPRNEASERMAMVPEGATLVRATTDSFPVVQVRNVFVFPGVPKLFHRKFRAIAGLLAGAPIHTDRLYTEQRETEIASDLGAVQEAEPSVSIGSYPRHGEGPWRVIVTLESRDPQALARARSALLARLPWVPRGEAG